MDEPDLLAALPTDFKRNTVAVTWRYVPEKAGYARFITPFKKAGLECWVAPGVSNWDRVYPSYNSALTNIQQFTAEGQRLGCTGQLNTVWNNDGEGLFNADWYGVLFGAAAAWQAGQSSIDDFQSAYGTVFHGDTVGKINDAQRELMAAQALLETQHPGSDGTDHLFWLDPWSTEGLKVRDSIRPYTHDLRMHAENAIVIILNARRANSLREADALDAMELGARRLDLIGLKFQLTDEIAASYAHAVALQKSADKEAQKETLLELKSISHPNFVYGKLEDLRDSYTLVGDLYRKAYLRSYKPYWLGNITARYEMTIQLWISRMELVHTAESQWTETRTLPPAASLGIPAPPLKDAQVP